MDTPKDVVFGAFGTLRRCFPDFPLPPRRMSSLAESPRDSMLCESRRLRHCENVRFGSKADISAAFADVRFTPESGHMRATRYVSISDNRGEWNLLKEQFHALVRERSDKT